MPTYDNLTIHNPSGYPYGINIDHNFVGTGWAREYKFSYNGSGTLFAFGPYGRDGDLIYGYIGGNSTEGAAYTNPWLAFKPNGDVGIGITEPDEKLDVDGDVKVRGARIKNVNGFGIIETNSNDWLRINPDDNYPATAFYKPVSIGTGGLSIGEWNPLPQGELKVTQGAYLATDGGKVGIGTTSPQSMLHVLGNNILLDTDGTNEDKSLYFRYTIGKTASIASDGELNFMTGDPGGTAKLVRTGSSCRAASPFSYKYRLDNAAG